MASRLVGCGDGAWVVDDCLFRVTFVNGLMVALVSSPAVSWRAAACRTLFMVDAGWLLEVSAGPVVEAASAEVPAEVFAAVVAAPTDGADCCCFNTGADFAALDESEVSEVFELPAFELSAFELSDFELSAFELLPLSGCLSSVA